MTKYITSYAMRRETFFGQARQHGWHAADNSILKKNGRVITVEQHGSRVIIRGLGPADAEKFYGLISDDDPRFQTLYHEELGDD